MSDIPIERRQQLLSTHAYMAMKCDAWELYWMELHKQIESDPLIKRVK